MSKTDIEYERRLRAVELALGASSQDIKVELIIEKATAIYAFTTGDAVADRPTSAPTTTSTLNADVGEASSGGATGSPATSTTAEQGNSGAASGAAAPDAGNQAATGGAQAASGPLSEDQVKTLQSKCMALSQRDGSAALKAEFEKVGANKWSEVTPEKQPVLLASLEAMGL